MFQGNFIGNAAATALIGSLLPRDLDTDLSDCWIRKSACTRLRTSFQNVAIDDVCICKGKMPAVESDSDSESEGSEVYLNNDDDGECSFSWSSLIMFRFEFSHCIHLLSFPLDSIGPDAARPAAQQEQPPRQDVVQQSRYPTRQQTRNNNSV